MNSQSLHQQLITESKRQVAELSLVRIEKCLDQLSEEEIWRRPGPTTVSIGNLILHLAGNVRQWIVVGLGGAEDHRVRQEEFDTVGPVPTEELREVLRGAVADTTAVLDQLGPDELMATYRVQGFDETGTGMLVHVVEHFSYHTGQISYWTKIMKTLDLDYYDESDLDVTGDN